MSVLNKLSDAERQAVVNFQEYLKIPSVHPDIDYEPCVKFLRSLADGLGLPCTVHNITPKKPIVLITWVGTDPALDSVLLNSHMDVVPVFEDQWTHKPFSAHIDEKGNIYGRGSQDMKCVGIQYLEAIRKLKKEGVRLKRTLHVSFVPDEETGGHLGMEEFVLTQAFRDLKVGFALDEGMASSNDVYNVFYGERCTWRITIRCSGQSGHGSLLVSNTPGEKVRLLLDKIYDFRDRQIQKLNDDSNLTLGDVTSINLTMLQGGVQPNVIPQEFVMDMDCRIPLTTDITKWEEIVNQWCKESGEGVRVEYKSKPTHSPVTELVDSNYFWMVFRKTFAEIGLKMKTAIFPAGTDSDCLRKIGIPCLSFSPICNTPILLHDHNEHLNMNVFLRGIEIYTKILTAIANV